MKPISNYRIATKLTIYLLVTTFIMSSQFVFADEKSHLSVAKQLTKLTYNEQVAYETARKVALLAVKDRFENNPKTRNYSEVIINSLMEVLDAYFHDPETQDKMRNMYYKLYMEEFTEQELKEFVKFYRTTAGQKALSKLPTVMQKGWERGAEIGSQVATSPKYNKMLSDKINELQSKGLLPEELN